MWYWKNSQKMILSFWQACQINEPKIAQKILQETQWNLSNKENIKNLSNPGVISRQILNPENSKGERVTITEVHLEPSAIQPRHTHEASEQIWYAVKGKGILLLADDEEKDFLAGDVARFAEGDVHGLRNDSNEEFIYISVTSPPINFGYAYKNKS